jgi:non-ribosomal peptide synthetase component F
LTDVVFGLTLSGRDAPVPGIECIGGPTLMTVPRRVPIDRYATVGDLLESMQSRNSLLLAHGHIGIQAIKRLPGLQRLGFQNLLTTHIRNKEQKSTLFEIVATPDADDFHTLPLLVSCTSYRRPKDFQSRIEIEANFDQNIISKERAERMMSQLANVARQFCETSRLLQDIDVYTSEDKAQIENWSCEDPVLVNASIQDIVYDHSQLSPFATAICSWDGNFTNQQLESISNQIASYFRSSFEVHYNSVVLIYLERSK